MTCVNACGPCIARPLATRSTHLHARTHARTHVHICEHTGSTHACEYTGSTHACAYTCVPKFGTFVPTMKAHTGWVTCSDLASSRTGRCNMEPHVGTGGPGLPGAANSPQARSRRKLANACNSLQTLQTARARGVIAEGGPDARVHPTARGIGACLTATSGVAGGGSSLRPRRRSRRRLCWSRWWVLWDQGSGCRRPRHRGAGARGGPRRTAAREAVPHTMPPEVRA